MQVKIWITLAMAACLGAGAHAADGNAEMAKGKISMCVGCHGVPDYKTAFPSVYKVPKLGGQHPQYIVAALKEYKRGERSHPTMRAIAESLSEQDMADIAAYYGDAK
ncbi:MAG: cytochrome c [Rhodocyclaceae bacterium]|nr:cytochrome c [Rhodocyclaceae bacterium]MBX3666831.1 cytochrome c [Rhodocyclaceae bacterium]